MKLISRCVKNGSARLTAATHFGLSRTPLYQEARLPVSVTRSVTGSEYDSRQSLSVNALSVLRR